jgi:hypothetical protein
MRIKEIFRFGQDGYERGGGWGGCSHSGGWGDWGGWGGCSHWGGWGDWGGWGHHWGGWGGGLLGIHLHVDL